MILRGNDGLYYDVDLDGNVKGPLVMRNSHVQAPISPPSYAESIMSRLPAADIVGFRPDSPGVVPGGEESRGRSPGEAFPQTWRPLAGLPSNKHGGGIVIDTTDELVVGIPQVVVDARSQGEDAEQIQVCLGFETQGELFNAGFSDVNIASQALLEWGIGGASFKAKCDWLQGTILSLPANFLRVSAIPPSNTLAGPTPVPPFVYSVGLAYGYGKRHCNTARLTEAQVSLGIGATSAQFLIPKFAVSYQIVVRAAIEVPLNINQVGPSGLPPNVTHQYSNINNSGGQQDYMFPIVSGARKLFVENISGVAVKFHVIWGLAF